MPILFAWILFAAAATQSASGVSTSAAPITPYSAESTPAKWDALRAVVLHDSVVQGAFFFGWRNFLNRLDSLSWTQAATAARCAGITTNYLGDLENGRTWTLRGGLPNCYRQALLRLKINPVQLADVARFIGVGGAVEITPAAVAIPPAGTLFVYDTTYDTTFINTGGGSDPVMSLALNGVIFNLENGNGVQPFQEVVGLAPAGFRVKSDFLSVFRSILGDLEAGIITQAQAAGALEALTDTP